MTSLSKQEAVVGMATSQVDASEDSLDRHKPLRQLPDLMFHRHSAEYTPVRSQLLQDPLRVATWRMWTHPSTVVRLPPRPEAGLADTEPRAQRSGVGVVLEQLDHVPQPVPELRSAAHLGQHAEEVSVGDPFPGDVGQQVGVVRGLAQDDLGVVRVEVHLERVQTHNVKGKKTIQFVFVCYEPAECRC